MAATPYATVEEFRLQSDSIDVQWDFAIQMCLDAAGEAIDRWCNQGVSFVTGATATTRLYAGSARNTLRIDKCTVVTLVEVKEVATWTALAAGDWVAFSGDAKRPNFNSTPFSGLLLTGDGRTAWPDSALPIVRVTARWGIANEVPANVKEATIAQAYRWFKRAQGAWGDALSSSELGQVLFRRAIDPDIQMMLKEARLIKPALG